MKLSQSFVLSLALPLVSHLLYGVSAAKQGRLLTKEEMMKSKGGDGQFYYCPEGAGSGCAGPNSCEWDFISGFYTRRTYLGPIPQCQWSANPFNSCFNGLQKNCYVDTDWLDDQCKLTRAPGNPIYSTNAACN